MYSRCIYVHVPLRLAIDNSFFSLFPLCSVVLYAQDLSCTLYTLLKYEATPPYLQLTYISAVMYVALSVRGDHMTHSSNTQDTSMNVAVGIGKQCQCFHTVASTPVEKG